MLRSRTIVRKTRQGAIRKEVREHYLRDDIYCGAPFCKVCDVSVARLSGSPSSVLIVDTNVVLNQLSEWQHNGITIILVTLFASYCSQMTGRIRGRPWMREFWQRQLNHM